MERGNYAAPTSEAAMQTFTKPDKQQVRDYMDLRVKAKTPPPDMDEIRRQLGFPMGLGNKDADCPR